MSSIEESIVARLRAYTEVTNIVGQRSYLMVVPQGQSLPACVVTTVGAQRIVAHDAAISAVSKFLQVSAIATSVGQAKQLATAVRHALHDLRGIVEGVLVFYAEVQNETDLFDPDYAFQVALDVEVSFRET